MCAQVAPAYGLRDSRTHPDEIIETLIKRSTKGNWTLLQIPELKRDFVRTEFLVLVFLFELRRRSFSPWCILFVPAAIVGFIHFFTATK